MGHPSLDSLTSMDSDVKFKDEEFGSDMIPVPFANKDSNAIQLQATVDATTCVPGLRHLAAYEMISPRTARAERRRETKTHCCIAGVKTKGKRHGRP